MTVSNSNQILEVLTKWYVQHRTACDLFCTNGYFFCCVPCDAMKDANKIDHFTFIRLESLIESLDTLRKFERLTNDSNLKNSN